MGSPIPGILDPSGLVLSPSGHFHLNDQPTEHPLMQVCRGHQLGIYRHSAAYRVKGEGGKTRETPGCRRLFLLLLLLAAAHELN
jgi:hypothetical protein